MLIGDQTRRYPILSRRFSRSAQISRKQNGSPFANDGLLYLAPPKDVSACTAVTLGDARDDSVSDHRKIIMKLHVNWGHASAHQLERVMVDSEEGNSRFADFADEVLEQCETCRAFDKATHVPISGTSTVSMFNEEVQVDPHLLDDIIARRAMEMFPKYPLLLPKQPKNPQEVGDVLRS